MVIYSRVRGTSNSPSGAASQSVFSGALRVNTDGTLTRVGDFALSAYDPQVTSDGWLISSNRTIRTEYPAGSTSMSKTYESDSFWFDGDLNRDTRFCPADRAAFAAALGTTIADDAFNPRADFDFDQDVDMNDYAPFVAAWSASMASPTGGADYDCDGVRGEAIDIQAAKADYDCDGFVTSTDLFAFLDAWFATSLIADHDGDGTVTTTDLFDYQDAWFPTSGMGC